MNRRSINPYGYITTTYYNDRRYPYYSRNRFQNIARPGFRYLTGTTDSLLRWFRHVRSYCVFEVIGELVHVVPFNPAQPFTTRLVIRGRSGCHLNILYVGPQYINISKFELGVILRCVGKKHDYTTMKLYRVREASFVERDTLVEMNYFSEQEFQRMVRF